MTLRSVRLPALACALGALAGCASAGRTSAADGPAPASCAAAPQLDDARVAAAFDSLHALATRGRPQKDLVLAPHERKPQLANPGEVRRLLATHYPPALRDAGVVGKSEVAVLIDAAGSVSNALVVRGASHNDFNLATIAVVRGMRFRPAAQGGCPVPFFSLIPVTWTLEPDR